MVFCAVVLYGETIVKLAISGKGGVGKSTLAAAIAMLLSRNGGRTLAVDADPDANLASALGISAAEQEGIVAIADRKALVEERTGAKVKQYGQIFKLNPNVEDIADTCAYTHNGVSLLVLGAVDTGGSGCACPESVLLRALVTDLVLYKNDSLVMDMEAGIEHLGRATARGVDTLLVVVEPGQRSIDCALRVRRMAAEIGLTKLLAVANKVSSQADEAFIREALGSVELIGSIPFSLDLRNADRDGISVLDGADAPMRAAFASILGEVQRRGEG